MNASEMHKIHTAYLSLGSNIQPAENLCRAVGLLAKHGKIIGQSQIYQTEAYGSSGPDFLNMTIVLLTTLSPAQIKQQIITPVEVELGRVRTDDKYAERTIDLDVIVFDDEVIDAELWQRVYLALPVSELLPNLMDPESGLPLHQVAEQLRQTQRIQTAKGC